MAKKNTPKQEQKKDSNWIAISILSLLVGCVTFLMWDRFSTQHVMCAIENVDSGTGLINFICKRN